MKKSVLRKSILAFIALFSLLFVYSSCDSWMSEDDGFYEEIESEVKRANATVVNVYVRYAATKMGKTDPDGYATFKVDIPATVSATTETDYGFKRWAAFPTSFIVPGDTQYTNFVYDDDDSYAANYGSHELSSEVVTFADPYASTTEVTINEERNDIYLVPIVAKRPTVALSMPSSGSSGIVRNMTVRINFTKAMNPESFKDASGVYDKITVTQGTQSITADGDIEIASDEITNRFAAPTFSTNGKMITLKFNPESISEGYSAQSYVTINISKDVTDMYGYSMAEDYKLQFQVGSSFDTLAPRISELTAGVGKSFTTFGGVYKDAGTSAALGGLTKITVDGASRADKNINNDFFTEELCSARITDKINIRVVAEDIAGAGSGQDPTGAESEVSMLGVKATSLVLMNGEPALNENALPIKSMAYVAQTNSSEVEGSYRDITGTNKGYAFTYDLSTLPDGLIKVDVWAYDSIGNNGYADGGAYSSEYGNGYASIFVVKDTTAPDAVANEALVATSSLAAPYGWYNAKSLSSMKLYEVSKNVINDVGHPKLRSSPDKLQWFFNVTSETDWAASVTKTDTRWKLVSDGYSIADAAIPAQDGPVAISLILMDDLGNISAAAPMSSIMYDNTPAVISGTAWVNADGSVALNASKDVVLPTQILKIPYTENLSGIRRVEVSVNDVPEPLSSVHFYKALPPSAENEIAIDAKDSAITANMLITSDALASGTLYVTGIRIGDTDGIYTVSVDMYDASLNKSNVVSTAISKDTTKPVIVGNSIAVKDMITSTSYDGTARNYLPASAYDESKNATLETLSFTVQETGSGIEYINFTDETTVNLTAASELSVNGQKLVKNTENAEAYDYVITGNSIRLHDSYSPKLFGENVEVVITNVQFSRNNAENTAKITIKDFVNYDSNTDAGAAVTPVLVADNAVPSIESVIVSDQTEKDDNNFVNTDIYEAKKYTDTSFVALTVKLASENNVNGTGVKSLKIVNGAFTNTSVLTVDGVTVPCSFNGDTVEFNAPFANGETLVFSNVQFLDLTDGEKLITVIPTDLIGWTGTDVNSNTIIYDTVAPAVAEGVSWTVTSEKAYTEGITHQQFLSSQILHIPYTEDTTGLKKLRIKVYEYTLASGQVVRGINTTSTPFESAVVKIGDTVLSAGSDYYVSSTDSNAIIFNDVNTYKAGELIIENLKVNDTKSHDGGYIFDISLMDKSENSDGLSNKSITLIRDTVNPSINKIEFPGAQIIQQTTDGSTYTYWFNSNVFSGYQGAVNKLTAKVTVKEVTSGLKHFVLGGNLRYTDSTIVTVTKNSQDRVLTKNTDYTVSEDFTKINLTDYFNPIMKSDDEFVVTLTNLQLVSTINCQPVVIQVTATDWALNEATPQNTVTLESMHETTADIIYFSNEVPTVSSVVIKDRGTDNGTDGIYNAAEGYTNENTVNLYFNVTKGTSSGISGFRLSTGATITEESVITVNNGAVIAYEVSSNDYIFFKDNRVYGADVSFKITNVVLENGVNGAHTINVYALTSTGFNNGTACSGGSGAGAVVLDTVPPEVGTLSWIAISGNNGYMKGNILSNQELSVPYAENITNQTSAVKYIEISTTQKDDTSYTTPLKAAEFKLFYEGTELVKDTDYTINAGYNMIALVTPRTSGTFKLQGLQISDSAEGLDGTYGFKVYYTDISGNKNSSTPGTVTIINDSTAPVVEKIEIPGIKYSEDITDSASHSYWLDSDYIGGTGTTNYAPSAASVYITINEEVAGVQMLEFGGTMKLQSSSTLWTVAADETETPVDSATYNIDTTANTITIPSLENAHNYKNDGVNHVKFLVKNMQFASGENTVSVKARDVALNESAANTTITRKEDGANIANFYSDSVAPKFATTNASVLVDRTSEAGIIATAGYTNESTVNLNINIASEHSASGHCKFTLNGASFTDSTVITYGESNTTIDQAKWHLADEKKSVVFENSGKYFVFRNETNITFTNVELSDGTTEGTHRVTVTSTDLSGWNSSNSPTAEIILDITKPTWRFEEGTFAANKSETIKGEFIYPHPNATDTAYGIKSPTAEKNKDGEIVLYYYTASKISGLANYGVVIGIGGKDANLRGYDDKNGVPYYICDTTSVSLGEVDAKYVVTHGSMPSKDCNNNTTGSNSAWKTEVNGWEIMFAGRTYSIVIVDEAGNYSEKAKTIKIVEDTTKPTRTIDGSDYYKSGDKGDISLTEAAKDESFKFNDAQTLLNLITIKTPASSYVYRNTKVAEHNRNSSTYDYWDTEKHSASLTVRDYVTKQTDTKYQVVIKLGSGTTASDILLGGGNAAVKSAYKDARATENNSPIEYYSISHWYGNWHCESGNQTYEPAFPSIGSATPDDSNIKTYFNFRNNDNSTWQTSKASWHRYYAGATGYKDGNVSSYVDENGNIVIEIPNSGDTPPMFLLLKDGCGNMNYLPITLKNNAVSELGKDMVGWVVDNKLGGAKNHCETENGRTKDRAVLINPGIDMNKTDVTVGSHTFAWGNQSSSYKTSDHGGVSVTGRLVKNLVTNTTYYNDNAWLCLSVQGGESILFNTTAGPTTDTTNYTGRAKLYLSKTELSDSNAYATISQAKTENGIATDWNYYSCKASDDVMHFVFQYPHPNYAALGWAANEPFYIYYLVEDFVGNYDIHKVVNDDLDNMDKWVYDNAAPVLTLVDGTTATPFSNYYVFDPADISKLIPENNGYRAYNGGSGVYISAQADDNHTKLRAGATQNPSVGIGTTRHVEGSTDNSTESRKNLMFFDIKVKSEVSGIRAFCYSKSSAAPAIDNTKILSECNTQGDNEAKVWYAGYGALDLHAPIGCDWHYYKDDDKTTTDNTNRYDESDVYKTSGSKYRYTGTKINTVFPYGLISESTYTPIYLHVMDWVGNIATYQMGNFSYKNDLTKPVNSTTITTGKVESTNNLLEKTSTTGQNLYVSATSGDLEVAVPATWYDENGSGIYGYSINNTNNIVNATDSKLTIPYSTYSKWSDSGSDLTYYIFDNVGNVASKTFKGYYDTTAPTLVTTINAGGAETGKQVYDADSKMYVNTGTVEVAADTKNFRKTKSELYTTLTDIKSASRNLYVNGTKVLFHINSLDTRMYKGIVKHWDGTKWVDTEYSTISAGNSVDITADEDGDTVSYKGTNHCYVSDKFTLDSANPYYCTVMVDKAQNKTYQYFKIQTDTTVPTAEIVSDSIEKVNRVDIYNYYNANSKAKMRFKDAGSGLKEYGSGTAVSTYITETSEIEVNLGTMAPASNKLKFTATDNLGNTGSINLTYNGVENWIRVISAPTYTPVANQSAVKVGKKNVSDTVYSVANGNFKLNNCNNSKQASIYCNYNTDTKETNIIVNPQVYNFTFKLPSVSDDYFYGWKLTSSPLADTSWFDAATGGTVDKYTNGYSFYRNGYKNSGDNQKLPDTGTKLYFYPIDMAGNIGEPVILSFVQAPLPIVGTVTPSGTINNYYNGNSTVSVEAVYSWGSGNMPIHYIAISDENNNYKLVDVKSQSITLPKKGEKHTFDNISLNGITGSKIDFEIITDLTSSEVKSLETLTYDGTGPSNIKVNSVSNQGDNSNYVKKSDDGLTVTYGSNATSIVITPTASDDAGIEGFSDSEDGTYGTTVTFNPAALPATPKIWAKDKLGNISSQSIALTKDASVSNVTGITVNTPDIGNGIYFDSTNKKLYFNVASVKLTPLTTDTDIDYFYYNDVSNKSTGGSFTITPADAIYTFYAVDKLGNVSSTGYAVTFTKDDSVNTPTATLEWYNGETPVASPGNYLYDAGTTVYYNSNKLNKIKFTPSATPDDSGIVGYATSSTAADADWKMPTVEITDLSRAITIYAKDRVGNVSEPLTYNFTEDITAPTTTTGKDNDGTNENVTGYSYEGTVTDAYDNEVGKEYFTNFYNTFTLSPSVTETGSGLYGYAITDSITPPADRTGYTKASSVTNASLDSVATGLHVVPYIHLIDNVGNVTSLPIGNPTTYYKNWWRKYEANATDNVKYSVSYGTFANVNGKVQATATIKVTGLKSSAPLKSISFSSLPSSMTINNGSDISMNVNWTLDGVDLYNADGATIQSKATTSATLKNSSVEFGKYYIPNGGIVDVKLVYSIENESSAQWSFVNNQSSYTVTNPSIILSSVVDMYDGSVIPSAQTPANNSRKSFAASAVASVKSLFTPKTKKIDLAPKAFDSEKAAPAPSSESLAAQAKTSATVVEKSAAQNKKKAPARTKALKSRVAEAESVVTQSVAVPENGTLMAAAPIVINTEALNSDINIEESSSIITVVEKDEAPKHTVPLYLVIFTIAAGIFIAGVIISSKKIIDKYN